MLYYEKPLQDATYMNKNTFIIACVIMVCMLVAVVGCTPPTSTTSIQKPSPDTTPYGIVATTSATYTNTALGITFSYPALYEPDTKNERGYFGGVPVRYADIAATNVFEISLQNIESIDAEYNMLLAHPRTMSESELSLTKFQIEGMDAGIITFTHRDSSRVTLLYLVRFPKPVTSIPITATPGVVDEGQYCFFSISIGGTTKNDTEITRKAMDTIVQTFHFMK